MPTYDEYQSKITALKTHTIKNGCTPEEQATARALTMTLWAHQQTLVHTTQLPHTHPYTPTHADTILQEVRETAKNTPIPRTTWLDTIKSRLGY